MDIDFECTAKCTTCGDDLTVTDVDYKYGVHLSVDPCETCLAKATDDGDGEGYKRGYADGEDEAKL